MSAIKLSYCDKIVGRKRLKKKKIHNQKGRKMLKKKGECERGRNLE